MSWLDPSSADFAAKQAAARSKADIAAGIRRRAAGVTWAPADNSNIKDIALAFTGPTHLSAGADATTNMAANTSLDDADKAVEAEMMDALDRCASRLDYCFVKALNADR